MIEDSKNWRFKFQRYSYPNISDRFEILLVGITIVEHRISVDCWCHIRCPTGFGQYLDHGVVVRAASCKVCVEVAHVVISFA